ncbi:DUF397 domain-containing protein [Streptomyces varsoviensis]|uniref:DUF397 domain-containing protein n=1 Tax=Streptomyces varsoviensis TaxID=67373 RepID=A0ABR5J2I8_9ACTN|nr:DUF397 domain-containing protein [Streptomyces varsoviensis]KOG87633.1 hypothetical protein ADK38_24335 [Streptomyces varsoviensis]
MSSFIWQKSSFSGSGQDDCVEVAAGLDGRIHVRESDEPEAVLAASRSAWGAFLRSVKAGG